MDAKTVISRKYFTRTELGKLLPGAALAMRSALNWVVYSACPRTGKEFRVERVIVNGTICYSVLAI